MTEGQQDEIARLRRRRWKVDILATLPLLVGLAIITWTVEPGGQLLKGLFTAITGMLITALFAGAVIIRV